MSDELKDPCMWVCKHHGYYRSAGCVFCDEAWQRKINAADIGTPNKIKPMDTSKLDLTPTPARKDDSAKPDMTLVTYSMVAPAAKILKFGEQKYGRYNYRNPNPGFEQRLIAATIRHLLQHTDGQELDDESKESHLAHALASLMLIFDRRAHKKEGEEL